MKAILVREFGGPEVLRLEEVPTPKPAAGQVLVRIHAAGVNPYDTYMRAGTYAVKPPLPYTPGSDGAGVVAVIGDEVKKVKPGDRVYTAKTVTGAYAEYALALEEQVHCLPEKISFGQGAGVWVPYGTAYHALYHSAEAHAPKACWCTAQAAESAARRCRWRAPWASPSSVRPERRKASTSQSGKVRIRFSITASRVIRKKS